MDSYESPLSKQLLSVQNKGELPFLHGLDRIISFEELPRSLIPDDYVAGTVVALRNHPLECRIVVGMVLGHHGQALRTWIVRRTLGDGP